MFVIDLIVGESSLQDLILLIIYKAPVKTKHHGLWLVLKNMNQI